MDVLLGLQWGDEGKGKIVDVLAPQYEVVARFQGGPNAGHTLEFDGIKHVLHQIPSGIFRSQILNIIGNGVVLDPIILKKEIEALGKFSIDYRKNLVISKKATIIVPTHKLLDAAYEQSKGDKKIGSTLKGIGPTYQDKIGRSALRIGDVLSPDFKEKYAVLLYKHKSTLSFYNYPLDALEEMERQFFDAIEFVKTLPLIDSEYTVNDALNGNKRILLWSQMHGNESTGTKALFDLFNCFSNNSSEFTTILENCTLLFIPMLNPDGAEVYTRVNANNIDLNRDAKSLTQPESRILRSIFVKIKPDLCLNLHDQRSIYGLKSGLSATISFLAVLTTI